MNLGGFANTLPYQLWIVVWTLGKFHVTGDIEFELSSCVEWRRVQGHFESDHYTGLEARIYHGTGQDSMMCSSDIPLDLQTYILQLPSPPHDNFETFSLRKTCFEKWYLPDFCTCIKAVCRHSSRNVVSITVTLKTKEEDSLESIEWVILQNVREGDFGRDHYYEDNEGSNDSILIGAVLGSIIGVLFLLAIILGVMLYKKRKQSKMISTEEGSEIRSSPVKVTNAYVGVSDIRPQTSIRSTEYAEIGDPPDDPERTGYAEIDDHAPRLSAVKRRLPSIPKNEQQNAAKNIYNNPQESIKSTGTTYNSIKSKASSTNTTQSGADTPYTEVDKPNLKRGLSDETQIVENDFYKTDDDKSVADTPYTEVDKPNLNRGLSDETQIVENDFCKTNDDKSGADTPYTEVDKPNLQRGLSDETQIVENDFYKTADDKEDPISRLDSVCDNTVIVENDLYDQNSE